MNVRDFVLAAIAIAMFGAATAHAAPTVADSVNGSASFRPNGWAAIEVGWLYTPDSDYLLVGVETKFSTVDDRTITLEVYDAHPGSGGTLLRSATFSPIAGEFAGGFFTGLALTAGEDYFIAFLNVAGLGLNVTVDPGAETLPMWGSLSSDSRWEIPGASYLQHPILLFYQETAPTVPEPGTMVLLGAGLAGLAFARRRRAA